MDEIKHSRRFAEIETLMGSYFRHHLVPVMTQTQTYLTEKQGEEMKEYSTSISGILIRFSMVIAIPATVGLTVLAGRRKCVHSNLPIT